MNPAGNRIAVIGAGLAGVAAATELARLGYRIDLYADPATPAASAVPLALLRPHLAAQRDPLERLRTLGLQTTRRWLAALEHRGIASGRVSDGIVILARTQRERRRLTRFPATGPGPRRLGADQVHASLGTVPAEPSLYHPAGSCVAPDRFIAGMLTVAGSAVQRQNHRVDHLEYRSGWSLHGPSMPAATHYDHVVLACGPATPRLCTTLQGRLAAARGQVTAIAPTARSMAQRHALSARGYVTPAVDGRHWVGATLQPGQYDLRARDEDDGDHAQRFKDLWGEPGAVLAQFVAIRAVTRDRIPIVGALAPGLWVSVGHGAHGLCTGPVSARIIATGICGRCHPLARWTSIERPALKQRSRLPRPASPH